MRKLHNSTMEVVPLAFTKLPHDIKICRVSISGNSFLPEMVHIDAVHRVDIVVILQFRPLVLKNSLRVPGSVSILMNIKEAWSVSTTSMTSQTRSLSRKLLPVLDSGMSARVTCRRTLRYLRNPKKASDTPSRTCESCSSRKFVRGGQRPRGSWKRCYSLCCGRGG